MLPAGAADPDREIRLALGLVAGHQELEHGDELLHETLGVGPAQHVIPYRFVEAGLGPELGDPVRVREKAHVEQQIDDPGHTALEPEGHDVDAHPTRRLVDEGMLDPSAEVVHAQFGRVDDDVRRSSDLLERLAFGGDLVGQPTLAHGVGSPGLLVAPDERGIVGIEIQHRGAHSPAAQPDERPVEVLEGEPCSAVDDDGQLLTDTLDETHSIHHLRDQRGGQVVHDEVAEILQNVGGLAPPRTRHAGHDHCTRFRHARVPFTHQPTVLGGPPRTGDPAPRCATRRGARRAASLPPPAAPPRRAHRHLPP